ncbi:MAG: hypothetical protein ABI906_06935 [Pseudomonadota bacterium]
MSRLSIPGAAVIGIAFALACGARAQPLGGPRAATPPPAVVAPPVPAFKIGGVVADRTGARLGPIESLGEADRGAMVVIRIDGKLVSVPQGTLALKPGGGAVSAQTKAQILAAAKAPR